MEQRTKRGEATNTGTGERHELIDQPERGRGLGGTELTSGRERERHTHTQRQRERQRQRDREIRETETETQRGGGGGGLVKLAITDKNFSYSTN